MSNAYGIICFFALTLCWIPISCFAADVLAFHAQKLALLDGIISMQILNSLVIVALHKIVIQKLVWRLAERYFAVFSFEIMSCCDVISFWLENALHVLKCFINDQKIGPCFQVILLRLAYTGGLRHSIHLYVSNYGIINSLSKTIKHALY